VSRWKKSIGYLRTLWLAVSATLCAYALVLNRSAEKSLSFLSLLFPQRILKPKKGPH
jgi:hypothetical protein